MSRLLIVSLLLLGIAAFGLLIMLSGENLTEEELFSKAKEKFGEGSTKDAIALYEELFEKFPESELRGDAIFMIGYLHANFNKEYDKARTYYELLINEYPEHEFVESAKAELEFLGLSPEELDKVLQEKISRSTQKNTIKK